MKFQHNGGAARILPFLSFLRGDATHGEIKASAWRSTLPMIVAML
jgi:hypothetical protein